MKRMKEREEWTRIFSEIRDAPYKRELNMGR
jgi:hypothetical protein